MGVEWTVITVIIALVGLFATVTKPIMNFNASIVKLTAQVDSIVENNEALNKKNAEIHDGLHSEIDDIRKTSRKNEERLNKHEVRIATLEIKTKGAN